METVACNLCGHESTHPVYRVKDTNYCQPGDFSLVACANCSLVYMNPRPTAHEIGTYYPAERYHPFRVIQQTQSIKPNTMQRKRADRITQILREMNACRILDVGCGSGQFLLAMQAQGCQVYGVEPNRQAAQFVKTMLNLPVITGDIFQVEQEHLFDAITFWDVLEHTHSPREVLLRAHHLLKPNGLLAINVPNWASWERRIFKENWIAIDAPRHLYHFSPNTLVKMLRSCGFEVIEMSSKTPVMNPASNLLSALGNLVRKAKKIKSNRSNPLQADNPQPSSTVKNRLIWATYIMLTIPNLLANVVKRGGSITVYARKRKYDPG